jgi:hypothetical protein
VHVPHTQRHLAKHRNHLLEVEIVFAEGLPRVFVVGRFSGKNHQLSLLFRFNLCKRLEKAEQVWVLAKPLQLTGTFSCCFYVLIIRKCRQIDDVDHLKLTILAWNPLYSEKTIKWFLVY